MQILVFSLNNEFARFSELAKFPKRGYGYEKPLSLIQGPIETITITNDPDDYKNISKNAGPIDISAIATLANLNLITATEFNDIIKLYE